MYVIEVNSIVATLIFNGPLHHRTIIIIIIIVM